MTIEGGDKVLGNLSRISAALIKQVQVLITKESRYMQSYVRTEHLTGGTSDTRLRVRSGRLRGSCIPIPTAVKGDSVEGGISFGTVYGRVHVGPRGQSTTIRPKTAKALAIPLKAALTASGVAKGSPRGGPWGETFIKKGIIFGKSKVMKGTKAGGLRSQIVPLFVLKQSVTIKARVHPEDIIDRVGPRIVEDFRAQGIKVD